MKTVFIYALNDPIRQHLGKTRYIGKSEDPYARYDHHLIACRKEKNHKSNWIRSLLMAGQAPVLEILDEVPEMEWQVWEREWIRLYRALGFRLTNGTDGGEGLFNPSAETRAKISASQSGEKCRLFGHRLSSEVRAKMSQARLGEKNPNFGKSPSAATRAKQRAAQCGAKSHFFGKHHSVETRNKIRVANSGKRRSVETLIKMSAASSGEKNPNFGKPWTDERRAKIQATWALKRKTPRGH